MIREEQKQLQAAAEAEAAKIKTVKQYAEKVFMPRITLTGSENTRSSYQGNLERYIYPVIGEVKLPEVTAPQINALLLNLQARGLKVATVIKVYTILSGLFKAAYMEDAIDRNPMDKVTRPRPTPDEILEQEEDTKSFTED